MRWLRAVIEVRQEGAIGNFEEKLVFTQAESFEKGREYLLQDARMNGWEPRVIRLIEEVSSAVYKAGEARPGGVFPVAPGLKKPPHPSVERYKRPGCFEIYDKPEDKDA